MIHPPDVIPKYAPDAVIGVLGEGGRYGSGSRRPGGEGRCRGGRA